MLAQLQYHYKSININDLSRQEQIELFARLRWAREHEAKFNPFSLNT